MSEKSNLALALLAGEVTDGIIAQRIIDGDEDAYTIGNNGDLNKLVEMGKRAERILIMNGYSSWVRDAKARGRK